MTDLLVIGYGNDLRCDDGAGRLVAEAIEELALPGVAVRSVAQLTPELALEIAAVSQVVFVDADLDAAEVQAAPVVPHEASAGGVVTHHGDPARLLALAAIVGAVPAEATVISIPATHLGLGSHLSPATSVGVAAAIEMIVTIAGAG